MRKGKSKSPVPQLHLPGRNTPSSSSSKTTTNFSLNFSPSLNSCLTKLLCSLPNGSYVPCWNFCCLYTSITFPTSPSTSCPSPTFPLFVQNPQITRFTNLLNYRYGSSVPTPFLGLFTVDFTFTTSSGDRVPSLGQDARLCIENGRNLFTT